jgi:hypothetical protein
MRVHSFTLSYTPRSMRCDSRAFLLAFTFASPCIGREPKARVVTTTKVGSHVEVKKSLGNKEKM